jgi:iron complex outermembrane recepter protein
LVHSAASAGAAPIGWILIGLIRLLSSLPLLLLAMPALAQSLPGAAGDEEEALSGVAVSGEIVVVAERYLGQLDVPQEPIATFGEADIQALGASSVAELLTAIAPQTGSGRGRGGGFPVVLVNGQRIASFREMRNYPPEAIKKVEVLPEEVALRLGFPANARVVNMILKDNYANRRLELDYGIPTRGGFAESEAEGTLLRIAGPSRYSLTLSAEDRSPLFEDERDLIPTGNPASAPFRSLIADSREFGLNANWTKGLGKGGLDGSLSVNANLSREDSHAYSGLDPLSGTVLDRIGHIDTAQAGFGLNRGLCKWQLAATLDAGHVETTQRTERADGTGGFEVSRAKNDSAASLVTLIGRPLRLPAGEVSATLKAGYAWSSIETATTLRRGDVSTGVTLGLPLASRREGVLGGLGQLTLDLSAGYNHLSDFGSLSDWSAGFNWSPSERLGLQASYFVNQAAPSLSQLGNPLTVTFNVPVFDFTRGETALVAVTSGGNPALRKEEQRDWKFGATWQVPGLPNATLIAEYFRNSSDNVTAGFPLLTPEIEAAFPGRATRDPTGRLIALDARAVTFAEQAATRLRWGLSLSDTIGKAPPGGRPGGIPGLGGARPSGPPPGMGPGSPRPPGAGAPGGGGGMMRMMGGGGQGRWSLGLYHTVQFTSRVLVAPGGPELDLLGGDALSTSGTPRHAIEFNGGLFHKGKGMFLNGSWTAPTRIATSDLRFGALTKVNLNLFVELGEQGKLAERAPFTKGLRLSLRLENLFDSRQRVSDGAGLVPLSYQKDYLDPRGRVIEFEIRKMF